MTITGESWGLLSHSSTLCAAQQLREGSREQGFPQQGLRGQNSVILKKAAVPQLAIDRKLYVLPLKIGTFWLFLYLQFFSFLHIFTVYSMVISQFVRQDSGWGIFLLIYSAVLCSFRLPACVFIRCILQESVFNIITKHKAGRNQVRSSSPAPGPGGTI